MDGLLIEYCKSHLDTKGLRRRRAGQLDVTERHTSFRRPLFETPRNFDAARPWCGHRWHEGPFLRAKHQPNILARLGKDLE